MLSQRMPSVLAAMDGTVGARRVQQISSKVCYCRGEIGIVGTALDDRLLLDERLIFSIQIEARLDRDRSMDTECHIVHLPGYKATHFSPGIRAQFEAPLYAVGRWGITSRSWLEMPIGRLSFSHLQYEIAAQFWAVKSRDPTRSLDF